MRTLGISEPNTRESSIVSQAENIIPSISLTFFLAQRKGKEKSLGWLKTVDASEASLWMRIDGEQRQLGFDNMSDRAVSGTTDWKMYSVILDVPNDAKSIFLGVLLIGKGQQAVGRNITGTNTSPADEADDSVYAKIPKATIKLPINLGFEEGKAP